MDSRAFFMVQAVVATVYALGFLIIPRAISRLYGVVANADTILAFRYFGVALLGLGLIFWFARDTKDKDARNAILGGAGISNQIGLVVTLWGTTSGIMNALGWSVALLYAALIAGCFYFAGDGTRVLKFRH
jgi:hypothetical protein